MANEINFKFKLNEDGSIKEVTAKTQKLAKETEKLSKSQDSLNKKKSHYNKQEKGAAGITSNSTKAFSKMQQGISGSGGLVPAYATLAANVFAVTAAFGVFQRAAQTEQLTKGMTELGKASGLALGTLSKGLVEATDGALTLEEAMRSTVAVTSAGLDPSNIERLGAAAKNASIALGRDTTDSIARLSRGITKLEPELLDELGIFVRLEEASETYARSLGKSASELTNYEKRLAFANATLEEAERKFGSIGENVEANPYDQLSASFQNLSKDILNAINTVLLPVVSLLANNMGVLLGAMVLFASTIAGDVLTSISSFSAKALGAADAQKQLQLKTAKSLPTFNRMSKTLTNLVDSLRDGKGSTREFQAAIEGQRASSISNLGQLKRGRIELDEYNKRLKINKDAIKAITKVEIQQRLSSAALAESKLIAALQEGRFGDALKNTRRAFKLYAGSINRARRNLTGFNLITTITSISLKGLGASLRAAGAGFLALLGPIGMLLSLGSLVYGWIKDFMEESKSPALKTFEKNVADVAEAQKELSVNLKEVDSYLKGQDSNITTLSGSYTAMSNILSQYNSQAKKLNVEGMSSSEITSAQAKSLKELISSSTTLSEAFEEDTGVSVLQAYSKSASDFVKVGQAFIDKNLAAARSMDAITQSGKALKPVLADYFNSIKGSTDIDPLASAVIDFDKSIQNAQKEGKALVDLFNDISDPNLKSLFAVEKDDTALQNTINSYNLLKAETDEYGKAMKNAQGTTLDYLSKEYSNRLLILATLDKQVNKLKEEQKAGPNAQEIKQRSAQLSDLVKNYQKEFIVKSKTIELNKQELATLKATGKIDLDTLQNRLDLENNIIDLTIEQLESRKSLRAEISASISDENTVLAIKEENKKTDEQIKTLTEQKTLGLETQLEIEKAKMAILNVQQAGERELLSIQQKSLDTQKAMNGLKVKLYELSLKESNRDNLNRDSAALNASDKLRVAQKTSALETEELLLEEFSLKIKQIDLEYDLLDARLAVVQAELKLAQQKNPKLDFSDSVSAIEQARGGIEGSRQQAKVYAQMQADYQRELTKDALIDAQQAALDESKNATGSTVDRMRAASAYGGALNTEEGGDNPLTDLQDRVQAVANIAQPMMDQLSALGPQGELVSSVAQGAFAISDAFMTAGKAIEGAGSNMEKGAAVAQAAGAAITAIGSILQAQSNATIHVLDEEIEAEKARDGQSEKSLSKIKALEAKKDAQKRKAFEQNKKVMMATTIANTAAAMMTALAPPPAGLGPVFGPALAGIAGAMGVAQLAIIAGTSYNGGSSASIPSAPTSVSVGQRGSSVDMASSKSASGELSYLRGSQGIGGADNFTPAFTGMKYRASGGETTGFVVGEQGPELFVPEKPGRIVPADETAQGTPINANINISAVDAAGVEQVLMRQRGNIIGMIREAANSKGETFLENVNTFEV